MGPLEGVRVIELVGIGPGPFAAMMLADQGAEVLRIDRVAAARSGGAFPRPDFDLMNRGRPSAAVDLKRPEGVELVLRLCERADVLLESYRPGVTERLGLGPEVCLGRNPALIYARMTGWGQEGPWAHRAGHDLTYLALTGTLSAIGRPGEPPVPPLNLVGDFGGGGMLMAYGIAAALVERARSGRGQVVDAAMTDGVAALSTSLHGMHQTGFQGPRGTNLLDGGAPFYDVYETGDGRYLAVAALEPRFYAALLEGLGLAGEALPEQWDREGWPVLRARFSQVLRSRSRDRWCQCFEELDACVAPVLELDEAPAHPHNRARGLFLEEEGRIQPAPAPRFSRTPGAVRSPAVAPGHDTEEALAAWGLDPGEIETLKEEGVVA